MSRPALAQLGASGAATPFLWVCAWDPVQGYWRPAAVMDEWITAAVDGSVTLIATPILSSVLVWVDHVEVQVEADVTFSYYDALDHGAYFTTPLSGGEVVHVNYWTWYPSAE